MATGVFNRRDDLIVLAFALAVRVWAALDARDAPFWRIPSLDEKAFLELAQALRAGVAPPHGAFFIAPGYAYVLAALGTVGGGLVAAKLLNLAAGAASAVLVTHLGRRTCSRPAALVAGLAWAVYPSALLQELLVSKSALATLAMLGSALAFAPSRADPPRAGRWAAGGALLGFGVLLRPEWLIACMVLFAFALLARRRGWPGAPSGRALAAAASCVALAVAVPTLQNVARTGDWVPIAYGSGSNFYIGNHAAAHGGYMPLRPDRSEPAYEETDANLLAQRDAGRALGPSAVSRFWWQRGFDWWRHRPADAMRLTLKKWALLWGPRELADGLSTRLASKWVAPLRMTYAAPSLLLPVALAGMWILRRRRDLWPQYALVAGMAAAIVPFFLFERFRLGLIAMSLPFALAAIEATWRGLRARAWRRTAVGVGLAGALACGLAVPRIPVDENALRAHLGGLFFEAKRYDEALLEFEIVRAALPDAWRVEINVANTHAARGDHAAASAAIERALVRLHAEAERTGMPSTEELAYCHELAGELARVLGRRDDASRHFIAALSFAAPANRARVQARLEALQLPVPAHP